MKLARLFMEHPASIGETYTEHMARAACFGARMLVAGFACLVHAVLPFWFVNTGSDAVSDLHNTLASRRRQTVDGSPAHSRKAVQS